MIDVYGKVCNGASRYLTPGMLSYVHVPNDLSKGILQIIIYLYKIAILHHGMQSFHIIVYCTSIYWTLVYCTIADRSDRFATSISLREHANERYADRFDA